LAAVATRVDGRRRPHPPGRAVGIGLTAATLVGGAAFAIAADGVAPARTVDPSPPSARAKPAADATHAFPEGSAEAHFLTLVNDLRARAGRGPLSVDPALAASAQGWARRLASDAALHHQDIGRFLDGWTTAGENVAFGPTVDSMFSALVASPRHYANIVKGEFSSVGIGVVPGPDGRLWTSQLFAG
jgi:uncharacterized protein YkwD